MSDSQHQRFPKSFRLTSKVEFDNVFKLGLVAADEVLVIHAIRTTNACLRIGISVSKRVGNAPYRNRWKRLIREVFRTQRSALPTSLDLIVRPRRGAVPSYDAIQRSLPKLVKRLDRELSHRKGV